MQNFLQRMYIAEFIEVGNKWLNCGDFLLKACKITVQSIVVAQ